MDGKVMHSFMTVLVMLSYSVCNNKTISLERSHMNATFSACKDLCSMGDPFRLCMNSSYCAYFCISNSHTMCKHFWCVKGWYGNDCDLPCSFGCINMTCESDGSSGNSGNCLNGSMVDWCDQRCEKTCGPSSMKCTCKSENQICLSDCMGWYYDENCDQPCSNVCGGSTCRCTAGSSDSFRETRCNHSCSSICVKILCKEDLTGNVSCPNGCEDGWWGSFCDQKCDPNCRRRQNITEECSNYSNSKSGNSDGCVEQGCDMNGVGRKGCELGWFGETCQISALWFLLPSFVAAVSLIVLVTTLLYKRNKSVFWSEEDLNRETADVELIGMKAHCTSYSRAEGCSLPTVNSLTRPHADKPTEGVPEVIPLLPSDLCVNHTSALHKVSLDDLERYVSMLKETDEMITQFRSLPIISLHPCEYGRLDKFIRMNRYDNILPYDYNRVVLDTDETDTSSDYINASHINGYVESTSFIATQGPFSDVIASFWTMLWQKDVNIIVMLTKCVEHNMAKCEQYWPNMGQAQMITPDVVVECLSEDVGDDITTRTFNITKGTHETRTMKQFHFTTWPDSDVPENVTSLLSLHTAVTTSPTTLAGPVVVHCSAGVGRTGTYIALDYLIQQAKAEGVVNVFECVLRLRHQRMNLVQTEVQYALIHDVLLQAIGSMRENERTTGPSVRLSMETGETTV